MSTLKRLSDEDVKAVFQSLHHGSDPPSHLHFQIVPVGPRGLKLSPPSHEFEGECVSQPAFISLEGGCFVG